MRKAGEKTRVMVGMTLAGDVGRSKCVSRAELGYRQRRYLHGYIMAARSPFNSI